MFESERLNYQRIVFIIFIVFYCFLLELGVDGCVGWRRVMVNGDYGDHNYFLFLFFIWRSFQSG